jgi:hypothetical protein
LLKWQLVRSLDAQSHWHLPRTLYTVIPKQWTLSLVYDFMAGHLLLSHCCLLSPATTNYATIKASRCREDGGPSVCPVLRWCCGLRTVRSFFLTLTSDFLREVVIVDCAAAVPDSMAEGGGKSFVLFSILALDSSRMILVYMTWVVCDNNNEFIASFYIPDKCSSLYFVKPTVLRRAVQTPTHTGRQVNRTATVAQNRIQQGKCSLLRQAYILQPLYLEYTPLPTSDSQHYRLINSKKRVIKCHLTHKKKQELLYSCIRSCVGVLPQHGSKL